MGLDGLGPDAELRPTLIVASSVDDVPHNLEPKRPIVASSIVSMTVVSSGCAYGA